jgi:hypothetical protein
MRIGLVLLLIYWCYKIAHPFLLIIFWESSYGTIKQYKPTRLGGRGTLAAILITLIPLILLIVPTYLLSICISSSKEF